MRDFCAKTFTGTLTAAVLTEGREGEGERGKDSEKSVRIGETELSCTS